MHLSEGSKWEEAIVTDSSDWDRALISLVAFASNRTPHLIGSGFIIQADGPTAVALTAAHNLDAIQVAQNSDRLAHPSALAEFLPSGREISLDKARVRVIYKRGKEVHAALVRAAFWDQNADIAALLIESQEKGAALFDTIISITSKRPAVGEVVCVAGYEMGAGFHERHYNGQEKFEMTRRMVLRRGQILGLHESHILCRGPCLETTIPVFGGMSGGPALFASEHPTAFGLISTSDEQKSTITDFSTPGSSIIALLPCDEKGSPDERRFQFEFNNARIKFNS